MQQVTLNLLTNALKFTNRHGQITLGGSFENDYITVYVKDTGDGIAAEDKPKLFKLFGKLKQKKGVNSRGIGLGLNICKQICELFEGNIDVDSVKGEGSKFYFSFKVTQEPVVNEEQG
jgi:signal transduction histidine kinase